MYFDGVGIPHSLKQTQDKENLAGLSSAQPSTKRKTKKPRVNGDIKVKKILNGNELIVRVHKKLENIETKDKKELEELAAHFGLKTNNEVWLSC